MSDDPLSLEQTRALVDELVREYLGFAEKHGLKTLMHLNSSNQDFFWFMASEDRDYFRARMGGEYAIHTWSDGTWKVYLEGTGYVDAFNLPNRVEAWWRLQFDRAMVKERYRQVDYLAAWQVRAGFDVENCAAGRLSWW